MVDVKQKEIIFGMIEVTLGLATVISLSMVTISTNAHSVNLLMFESSAAGVVPLMMRFSLRYWNGGTLPKAPELIIMIWSIVNFLIGGVTIIVLRADNKLVLDICYLPATLALVVGIIALVDLILGLLNK